MISGLSLTAAALAGLCLQTVSANVQFGGINIAGFDFQCTTDGSCPLGLSGGESLQNSPEQIQHFVQEGFNAFRLPVGWQYLVNSQLGGTLYEPNAKNYDALVKACTDSAKMCIIDIHNYARYDGAIIGQSQVTNAHFTSLWSQLGKRYAQYPNVAFGIMNEPHDLPSIDMWGQTVEQAVCAIRDAGAKSQYILLPGTNYTSATQFPSGSAATLGAVKDRDGTTNKLIFDVHKYFDSDSSGKDTECVGDQVAGTFAPLATYLRGAKRMAFLSEFGAGNNKPCTDDVTSMINFLNQNSDVYLGWTSWAAGAFDASYNLTETPTMVGNQWKDTSMVEALKVLAPGASGGQKGY